MRGSRAGESQFKTAFFSPSRVLGGQHWAACCAQARVFVSAFSRAKCSFGARGAPVPFIVAVVALQLAESRESEHSSSSSGVAKGHG